MLRVVRILVIEIQDVVEHFLGFDGRAFGVERDGFHIAVQRLLPVAPTTMLVALLVINGGLSPNPSPIGEGSFDFFVFQFLILNF